MTVGGDGIDWAWMSPGQYASVEESCPGARRFAFVRGFVPAAATGCGGGEGFGADNGWVRVPSADDANPESSGQAPTDDQGWVRVPSQSNGQQPNAPTAPAPDEDKQ